MTQVAPHPTVVVAVDGPGGSRATIRLAAREAGYRDAALIAVLAYGGNPALGSPAGRPLATMRTAEDERRAAEAALREAVVDALGDEADRVELRTVTGVTARSVVDVARTADADLLVLAERTGVANLLGAVSQYVLHKAPCPVLLVPETGSSA
jgi:nucleotide-binding universal stress UspA family protein